MHKRILIGLVVFLGLGATILGLVGAKAQQLGAMKAADKERPTEPVTTAKAQLQTWNPTLYSVGTLTAENGVTLSAEVPGTVTRIEFESGAQVEQGTLLAQLDVSVEQAQLRSAEASAELARLNAERIRELRSRDTLAQAELDAAEAQLKQAIANAEAIRAAIDKKTFRAPFSGTLGIRKVNVGQYVNSGQAIVELQTLAPIHVDFALPQQRVVDLAVGQPVEVTTDGVSGTKFLGKITALEALVDSATRNVRVRATLANEGAKLRPGMFANVEVVLPAGDPVVVVPASAILYAPYGDSVFVIERRKNAEGAEETVVRQQTVRLGLTRGDFVAVTSGVQAGDEVVSTGAFKLRNGGTVRINNSVAPAAELAPKPANS
ncbi:MAG TPA: efflux RND transporter periplasmic adaptor subunit [Opitutaceae bacterium]|nr:efflux RND transporter periplasmic adaptor subunit [Opitutaceae bacterium]